MKHTYFAFQVEHSVKIQSYYNVPPVNLNTIVSLKILQWKDFIQIIPIKNTSIPSQNEYEMQLLLKVEKVWKRMRRKALQFLEKLEENNM